MDHPKFRSLERGQHRYIWLYIIYFICGSLIIFSSKFGLFSIKKIKNGFSKKRHKIPMRGPPIEISGDRYFFSESWWKQKKNRGWGPPIDDLELLFQKSKPKIPNVFFVLLFFLKNRGNGGLFLRVRPKIFS